MKTTLMIALIALSLVNCAQEQQKFTDESEKLYTDLTTQTFNEQFLNAGADTLFLDVRTQEEFEAGHIPRAIHLHVEDPEFNTKVALLDSSKTVVVYCRTGVRSVTASEVLTAKLGFTDVQNLLGGYTAWTGKDTDK